VSLAARSRVALIVYANPAEQQAGQGMRCCYRELQIVKDELVRTSGGLGQRCAGQEQEAVGWLEPLQSAGAHVSRWAAERLGSERPLAATARALP
jgi:hypothetical protein